MRIAMLVSAAFPPREGMGFYVWNLSRYLVRQGHTVHIITRGGARSTACDITEGITIWRPAFLPVYPFHVDLHGLYINKLIRRLETGIDILHVHSPLSPVISTTRPIMLTFHSMVTEDVNRTQINDFYTLLMKLQAPVSFRLESGNLKRAKSVNAVSPLIARDLRRYPNCPPKIEVSWNGVDVESFKPLATGITNEKLVITVGRLAPGKGLEDLIDAASIVVKSDQEIKFQIVGEGTLRPSLLNRVREYGLENNVRLTGQISDRPSLIDLYQKSALFVLPSHHEGLPTVVLEAMACACPVLATRVGGIPWIIQDGENGSLIPPADPTILAEKILALLADPEYLKQLGRQARRTIESRFSWQCIGDWYIDQYRSLLAGGLN